MEDSAFVGTWQLVSFEYRDPDGTIRYPSGKGAVGRLIYSPGGRMAVQIMNPDRPLLSIEEGAGNDPQAVWAVLRGYIAYFGTYTVDWEAGIVTHHAEGSLLGNNLDGSRKRHFILEGDRLTLRTRPEEVGGLAWQRVE